METDKEFIRNLRDTYYSRLPLGISPLPMITIILAYLLFVQVIGPRYMKNRPAYKLNNFLIFYNVVQVVCSIYVFSLGVSLIRQHGVFDTTCSSQSKEHAVTVLYVGYCYFLAKVSELLDTVIFVLRKKQNQVTFLHIYHHSSMVISVWGFMKYDSSYASTFAATLNTFIHIVMYSYYGLSAIPAMRKYLWWKKYLTTMQLIQFVLILLHLVIYHKFSKCPPSIILYIVTCSNLTLFRYLFAKFYINSYLDKKQTKMNLDNFVCSNISTNSESSEIDDVKFINSNKTSKVRIVSSKQSLNSNGVSHMEMKKTH